MLSSVASHLSQCVSIISARLIIIIIKKNSKHEEEEVTQSLDNIKNTPPNENEIPGILQVAALFS